MKMLMIIYNEALDNEVMEILDRLDISGYTKIPKVFGKGNKSGIHLGTDIWPGLNNIIYAACQEEKAKEIFLELKELRSQLAHEGVKAFIMPLEESL